ncbi:MAG: ATP-binding protein [bacterium]
MNKKNGKLFRGGFGVITVRDLLEFLVEFEFSGKLVLNREAVIVFEHGDVIYANFSYISGMEALQEILKNYWEHFYFSLDYDKNQRNVSLDGEKLVKLRDQSFSHERKRNFDVDSSQFPEVSDSMLEFFSNLIHELGNPLTIIRGSMQMVERHVAQNKEVPDTVKEYVSQMESKISKQVERFTKLLASARMLSKPRTRRNTVYDTINLIKEWINRQRNSLSEDIQLHFTTEVKSLEFFGEPDELIQVMSNLLDNAENACNLSDNAQNNIVIYITQKKDNLLIFFEDNGIGIDENDKPKIFNAFFSSFKDHSGLGLNVVNAIITRMGGSVSISSKPGEGTEVLLKIPVKMNQYEIKSKQLSDRNSVGKVNH